MLEKIYGKDNAKLAAASRLKLKKYRDAENRFIVSGTKLALEAAEAGVRITEAFYSDGFLSKRAGFVSKIPAEASYGIPSAFSGRLCDEESPEGVFCVCEKPAPHSFAPGGFVLVCERISDPGNLGTILRSARAFSASVALSAGCADLYSPKVLRGAMGAAFYDKIYFCESAASFIDGLRAEGYGVYAAALHTRAVPLSQTDLTGRTAVAVGSEGSGLSAEAVGACGGALLIEMEPECESLNAAVAASVIMYRAYAQNRGMKT